MIYKVIKIQWLIILHKLSWQLKYQNPKIYHSLELFEDADMQVIL